MTTARFSLKNFASSSANLYSLHYGKILNKKGTQFGIGCVITFSPRKREKRRVPVQKYEQETAN
jgi:hypothetical protein